MIVLEQVTCASQCKEYSGMQILPGFIQLQHGRSRQIQQGTHMVPPMQFRTTRKKSSPSTQIVVEARCIINGDLCWGYQNAHSPTTHGFGAKCALQLVPHAQSRTRIGSHLRSWKKPRPRKYWYAWYLMVGGARISSCSVEIAKQRSTVHRPQRADQRHTVVWRPAW